MHVILERKGVVLASDGIEYVVIAHGREIFRGANKATAEKIAMAILGELKGRLF